MLCRVCVCRVCRSFDQRSSRSSFPEYIMQCIRREGFEKPTAIQSQGWPCSLSGRDVIGDFFFSFLVFFFFQNLIFCFFCFRSKVWLKLDQEK